jgi:serine protease Do
MSRWISGSMLALSMAVVYAGGVLTGRSQSVPARVDPAAPERMDDPSRSFVAAAKVAQPAVTHLIVTRLVRFRDPFEDFFSDPVFERFRRRLPPRVGKETSMGSGVLVHADGTILTNAHVVRDAAEIVAKLPDGRQFKASSFTVHDGTDLAVVRIEGKDLPAAELGDSEQVEVGQWTLAIGNPFGLEHTVTAGVVSAIRKGGAGDPYLQTDAAINPGNSGGPLIDLRGRVIGINTAIYSRTGGYQGIGFALPINLVKSVLEGMKKR